MTTTSTTSILVNATLAILGARSPEVTEKVAQSPGAGGGYLGAIESALAEMALEIGLFCAAFVAVKFASPRLWGAGPRRKQLCGKGCGAKTLAAPTRAAAPAPASKAPAPVQDPGAAAARSGRSGAFSAAAILRMVEKCGEASTAGAQAEAAASVEEHLAQHGADVPMQAYEKLLRIYTQWPASSYGVECLDRLVRSGRLPPTRLCRWLMTQCVDAKNVEMSEALAACLKSQQAMDLQCFKSLMRVYGAAGMHDKACDLYHEILDAGIEPDAAMYGSFMSFAAKAGRTALSQELVRRSEGAGCVKTLFAKVKTAGGHSDIQQILQITRQVQQLHPGSHAMACNVAFSALCSKQDMDGAAALLAHLERDGAQLNHITFNTIIKGYCQQGDPARARRILHKMEKAGLAPDVVSFSCLLHCAAKSSDFDGAWAVLSEIDARGFALDSHVVTILMQAARKTASAQQAARLLTILDRSDVQICADEVVFNCVMDTLIACKSAPRLEWAIRQFHDCSDRFNANVRTYGLLIKACTILGRTDDAADIWRAMLRRGIEPSEVTFGCFLDALVEGRAVEEASQVFEAWKGRVKHDTVTYSTLIKGFAAVEEPERAMALYEEMKSTGVMRNHFVYTSLIMGYARKGMMSEAKKILTDMLEDGCKPNAITYSAIIRGHCVCGDLSAALELLRKMSALGMYADVVVFNMLLDACIRQSAWEVAETLYEEMARQRVQRSSFTLSIVIKMWSKRGDLDKVFETVYGALSGAEGWQRGPLIDQKVGACLIGACIHNKEPKRAMDVFEEMKTWAGYPGPDTHTYNTMVTGLSKFGYPRQAAGIAGEACEALPRDGKALTTSTLSQLCRALRAAGLLAECAPKLAEQLRGARLHVDADWLKP